MVNATSVPAVYAAVDRAMWTTVVTNLLSNAVKYTDQGSIALELQVQDTDAVLTVADTGSGIPADEQARVFERFYRAASSDRSRGAGIGLALVADLIRVHLAREVPVVRSVWREGHRVA